ncbi:MAG: S49 family peptidase [Bacteroidia bacterium]|nr:S49 family peptidase [Bacteroidia bacterium]
MRNWKFLLSSQLVRGNWFLHDAYAIGGLVDAAQLLSPTQNLEALTQDLSQRPSYEVKHFSEGTPIFTAQVTDGQSFYDALPQGSRAIFSLSGTLLKYGTLCTYGTEEIGAFIQEAANHPNISGALFLIDSGGGAVNAVAPLTQAVQQFKALNKPTLALCDAAYSAAYWVAAECDYIMAANTISSGFGSIGVMTSWLDYSEYLKKLGVTEHIIYAPESTEKNLSYELAKAGKYEEIKTEDLSPLAKNFIKNVQSRRPQLVDDGKVLKGKTYLAEKALSIKLIDGIGNLQKAQEHLSNLITIQNFLNSK